jgi:hypothetical protein
LIRANEINTRILKLAEDIKNKTLDPEQVSKFSQYEKDNAQQLIDVAYRQQKLFHGSLQEFRTSLKEVELLIKSRNNGELPTIIKDSLAL